MRKCIPFNEGWFFTKEVINPVQAMHPIGDAISLPHTWNAVDGQDGGNDYYRGKCWYTKVFSLPELEPDEEVWLEFGGVNMAAEIYLNGKQLGCHEGGYSTFRINLTYTLQQNNLLAVAADNSPSRLIHPQQGDFTLYGGIYRNVNLILLPKSHFALGYHGGPGIRVTPKLDGDVALTIIEAWLENTPDGIPVKFAVEGVGEATVNVQNGLATANITIPKVHRWNGLSDPFLYTASAELNYGSDRVEIRFGCRNIEIDPKRGFFLNGHSYPLCGAARHQDRESVGYALVPEMHREDIAILKEMGANTVRLAHYQHDQYFYDLCDEVGMIVWAEIPYCTMDTPKARENAVSQLRELVLQNHHHPSVICWGLSNEITITTGVTEELLEMHRKMHTLCHELDTTSRPTTTANVYLVDTESPLLSTTDIRSYNLYFGWYDGEMPDMDRWFDTFHDSHPDMVIGLSEFGADANLQYQTSTPVKGDYSEAYQALYHEHMLEMRKKRPYIWAMYVWNMFDFGSDGRNEGGKQGINQKGLVTFDRKIKKDAFYIYKAYLSKDPFLHICGRRYVDRPEELTQIKVYSNLPMVTLYVDSKEVAEQAGDKIFVFDVPLSGEHSIEARAAGCSDTIFIRRVCEPNPNYALTDAIVTNWFEASNDSKGEFYSIEDRLGDIRKSPEGAALVEALLEKMRKGMGADAREQSSNGAMEQMINSISLKRLLSQSVASVQQDTLLQLDEALRKIRRI